MRKPKGRFRVICEGGSTTFDLLAAGGAATWPWRLARLLGSGADVVKGGPGGRPCRTSSHSSPAEWFEHDSDSHCMLLTADVRKALRHETKPFYRAILSAFKVRTGCPVVVNTSFNVRGEPIVSTPEGA